MTPLRLITSMRSKSSSVDFFPTSLLKLCPSVFSEGTFPTKSAAVTPLLKKPSLDPDNPANYRPISNLNNISKIIDHLFLSQFYPHVTSSPNFNHLQSAYRPHHSTEIALLQTFDDIFCSADRSQSTLLVSLDLSTAFDTIDHSRLLSRLSTSFGVRGAALAWLTSYLTNRTQTVRIGSVTSEPSICLSGVPRGSVLGPIVFSLFISPIGQIVSDFGISHQQYANDAQLYISLKSATAGTSISNLETCLSTLHSWLCFNGLSLIFISDHFDTSGARLLTTWLFQLLLHWSNHDFITATPYFSACHVSISTSSIQHVQNLAARLALNEWRSPTQQILVKLHWLSIQSRIKFKICTLTYKLLSVNQPANLRSLITSYVPPRLLRSSDQCLLTQPRTRACIGQRAFSVCVPSVWNSLPLSIRLSPTLATFKRNLKTFYFAPS